MSWTKLAAATAPLFLMACQSFLSFDRENARPTDVGPDVPDAGDAIEASTPPQVSLAGDAGDGADAEADARAAIGPTHGPAMAFVVADVTTGDGFLVDATEVSRGQFAEYLHATSGGTAGIDPARPAACASRTAFAAGQSPECASLQGPALAVGKDLPMSCVDWCTAWAFCRWAGKRLCGARGSGSRVPLDEAGNVDVSEWYVACATSDRHRYPYGDLYAPESCATESSGAHDVGLVTCAGAETGPFDMSGNVAEWENSCSDDGTQCAVRGGDYAEPANAVECESKNGTLAVDAFRPTLGFRCCGDATLGLPDADGGEL